MRVKQVAGSNQTKICPRCNRELPLEAYSKGNGVYGRRSICKECDKTIHNTPEARERRRLRRAERRSNVEGLREREKQTDLNRIITNEDAYKKYIVRSARRRALLKGIPFDIDYTDIHIPEYCPLLGIKLNKHVGEGRIFDDSPSLDKIVPELGSVRGNVWIISDRANRIKSNASLEELQLLVKNLENHWVH